MFSQQFMIRCHLVDFEIALWCRPHPPAVRALKWGLSHARPVQLWYCRQTFGNEFLFHVLYFHFSLCSSVSSVGLHFFIRSLPFFLISIDPLNGHYTWSETISVRVFEHLSALGPIARVSAWQQVLWLPRLVLGAVVGHRRFSFVKRSQTGEQERRAKERSR